MQLSLMTFMLELPLLLQSGWQWNEKNTAEMEQILEDAAAVGFQSVDLTFPVINGMGMDRTKQILEKNHLKVGSVICIGSLANEKMTDEETEMVYRDAVRVAKEIGTEHLMLVPGFPVRNEDADTLTETLIRRFGHLTEAAGQQGILCMIEDDPNLEIGMCTADQVEHILQNAPGLKLVYDTANMMVGGEEPVPYFDRLAKYAIHTHIKDTAPCEDDASWKNKGVGGTFFASMPHGLGAVDFEQVFKSFQRNGYDGIIALEYVPQKGISRREDFRRVYRMFAPFCE